MKYLLLGPHYSEEDKYLEEGTEVGDGTPFKWTRPPTPEMEGLDDASKKAVEKVKEKAPYGLDPLAGLKMMGVDE